jgi:hypothetical protein
MRFCSFVYSVVSVSTGSRRATNLALVSASPVPIASSPSAQLSETLHVSCWTLWNVINHHDPARDFKAPPALVPRTS